VTFCGFLKDLPFRLVFTTELYYVKIVSVMLSSEKMKQTNIVGTAKYYCLWLKYFFENPEVTPFL